MAAMNTFFILSAKYLFVVPLIIMLVYFFRQPRPNQKQIAVFSLIALLLSYVLGLVAGHLYFDPRPFVVGHFTPLIPHIADNGFPSDHALLVSAVAAVGMFLNRKLGWWLWLLAVVVAVARVYVGVHHATDVIGSFVISLFATSLVYYVLAKTRLSPKFSLLRRPRNFS